MSSLSFNYTLFQMVEDPSSNHISEMLVRFCMMDGFDNESVISNLVQALYEMRQVESEENLEDDDERVEVDVLDNPEDEFHSVYMKICKKEGINYVEGDSFWEDHWPTNCPWHKNEINIIAKLKVGWGEVFIRQCREYMLNNRDNG